MSATSNPANGDHSRQFEHRVSLPQEYTNYGWLNYLRDVNILGLCLDTWYYHEYYGDNGQAGMMGPSSRSVCSNAETVDCIIRQLGIFATAFEGFALLRPGFVIGVSDAEQRPSHSRLNIEAASLDALGQELRALSSSQMLTDISARLDINIRIRDFSGRVQEALVLNVGWLNFYSRRARVGDIQSPEVGEVQWKASLGTGMLPIFMYDNRPALAAVRKRWQDLRAEYPYKTWDDAEESQVSGMITLAAPPSGLRDNRELAEINRPRLFSAVSNWEAALGRTFSWLVPFD